MSSFAARLALAKSQAKARQPLHEVSFKAGWEARKIGEYRAAFGMLPSDLVPIEIPPMFSDVRSTVLAILQNPHGFQWTVQGFGMLRTYLDPETKTFRLNVWSRDLAVPLCSLIHDHPWNFESVIVCGALVNQRYKVDDCKPDPRVMVLPGGAVDLSERTPTHWQQRIVTGEGGGPAQGSAAKLVALTPLPVEIYSAGDSYRHHWDEVHETAYCDGTVTLNQRTDRLSDEAKVFWPEHMGPGGWVDAMPRPAQYGEIEHACKAALSRFVDSRGARRVG